MIRYYRWLYKWYNKVGMTAGNKVLLNNNDGTYRPAKLKGQIIGNIILSAYIAGVWYWGYLKGKEVGFNQQSALAPEWHEPQQEWISSERSVPYVNEWDKP